MQYNMIVTKLEVSGVIFGSGFFFQFSYKPKYMLFNKKKDGQINETVCLTSEQSSATVSIDISGVG